MMYGEHSCNQRKKSMVIRFIKAFHQLADLFLRFFMDMFPLELRLIVKNSSYLRTQDGAIEWFHNKILTPQRDQAPKCDRS